MRRRQIQRRFWRPWRIGLAGLSVSATFFGASLLGPHDPCSAVDWIGGQSIAALTGPSLLRHWPGEVEYADLKAANPPLPPLGELSTDQEALVKATCLLIDRAAIAGVVETQGDLANLLTPTGLRAAGAPPGRTDGWRIGLRTALTGGDCQGATDQPAAILLAQSFGAIHTAKGIVGAMSDRFGGVRPVPLNEDIYRLSLISPRNYFNSTQTKHFMVEEQGRPILINAYLENTAERVVDYAHGSVAIYEIIDLTPLRETLLAKQARCEAGPDLEQIPDLAL
ncbi:MAG: hypothetical protein AAGE80_08510 [Pseudomonadota bacterium]